MSIKSCNWIMRSNSGNTLVSTETKLFSDCREIYIIGEINDEMMVRFFQQVRVLLSENADEPINLYIDSSGGEIRAGLAMYEMLLSVQEKTEVNIYCLSKACSMAAVLLAAGKKGHRFLEKHSEVMIHEPLISAMSRESRSTSTMRSITDSLEKSKKTIDEILAKHTEKSIKDIAKATSFDNFMSADEAIAFGIADAIVAPFE